MKVVRGLIYTVLLAACQLVSNSAAKEDLKKLLLATLRDVLSNNGEPPSVRTQLGVINGRKVEAPQGGYVDEYLGIPFAKPPVGDLRYANPEPLDSLPSDPYEADYYQNACMQISDTTFGDFVGLDMWNSKNPHKEDCLYLNVWVPRTDTKNKQVAVWIYGGGFYSGSSSLAVYDGKALAAHTNMIIVSFNYRVGSFGYFSTGDEKVKGNFGMMDQVMALQWVQDNIESFGGSKDNVAIFGESAGAASASLLMLSDLSNDLFARAWIGSASSDSHWAWMSPKQAKLRSDVYLKKLNCSDVHDILNCLRAIDAETILAYEWVESHFMAIPWTPTLDGVFMKEDPYTALRSGSIKFKDVVLGVNQNEGTVQILRSMDALSKDGPSLLTYEQFIEAVDLIDWDLDMDDKLDVLLEYSPEDTDDEFANRDAVGEVCGDRSFSCPTIAEAEAFVDAGLNTYLYHFTHRASNEVWPEWMGVVHGAEIQFLFGMPLNKTRGYTEEEVDFSKTIMDYLANFAKTGNPNGGGLPRWPSHKNGVSHLIMNGPNYARSSSSAPVKPDRCQLWDAINKKNFNDVINRNWPETLQHVHASKLTGTT